MDNLQFLQSDNLSDEDHCSSSRDIFVNENIEALSIKLILKFMNIIPQYVPDYVKYMSDWGKDYQIPGGHCIIDKQVCGCGFTEYCIRPENPYHVILCSPRIILLKNKLDQHPGEDNLMYLDNECYKKEFKEFSKLTDSEIEKNNHDYISYISNKIRERYVSCCMNNQCFRVLCTYDSFHVAQEALRDSLQYFRVVVDEFQSIFLDSFFKADVEIEFMKSLATAPNVAYVSATPMLEKYMEKMVEFKDLPYYKLIWPQDKIEGAIIQEKWVASPENEAIKIVRTYRNSPYNRPVKDLNGTLIRSNEVVFYVNSLAMIKNIITRTNLDPSEVNIICSNTANNKKKIQKIRKSSLPAGVSFDIGEVPKKGEYHKMFTFCTSTVYLGADFYSTNAITVVLSDANINSMVLDVRLDLPQILGRQRLSENPWKNECIVFYKTLGDGMEMSRELFDKHKEDKEVSTQTLLNSINKMRIDNPESVKYYIDQVLTKIISSSKQKNNVCFNDEDQMGNTAVYLSKTHDGDVIYNNLLVLAEERAWDLCQKDYKSNITVRRSLEDIKNVEVLQYISETDRKAQTIIDKFRSLGNFEDKMALYCGVRDKYKSDQEMMSRLSVYFNNTPFESYYNFLGPDECKASRYVEAEISRRIYDRVHKDEISNRVYGEFSLGSIYSLKEIKEKLKYIYSRLGISKNPKATDILEYFNISEKKVTDKVTKKRVLCYQLTSIK